MHATPSDLLAHANPSPAQPLSQPPPPQILILRDRAPGWRRAPFWLGIVGGVLLAGWVSGDRGRHDPRPAPDTAPVHYDHTEIKPPVERQVPRRVTLVYQTQNGELARVLADAEHYSAFARTHAAQLERGRLELRRQVTTQLEQGMAAIFQQPDQRVPRFADWYFAYGTHYQLLWEALTSALRHTLTADDPKAAVAADLDRVIERQYERLVLKPEITDPQLQQLYRAVLDNAHQSYLRTLAAMQQEFQAFVAQRTTHLAGNAPVAELRLDWPAQLHKMRVAEDANATLGALRGITLTTVGTLAGQAIGAQVGTALALRLGLPFVERALLAASGGAAGGGAGSLGGPLGAAVGAVAGAGLGLAVDWLIQEGIELLSREAFETEVRTALASTQREWEQRLLPPLRAAVDVWFEDTLQLLPQFKP